MEEKRERILKKLEIYIERNIKIPAFARLTEINIPSKL
jgi:hypothetical protein